MRHLESSQVSSSKRSPTSIPSMSMTELLASTNELARASTNLTATSPMRPTSQQNGTLQNHDSLNYNQGSFNNSLHVEYHQHFGCSCCPESTLKAAAKVGSRQRHKATQLSSQVCDVNLSKSDCESPPGLPEGATHGQAGSVIQNIDAEKMVIPLVEECSFGAETSSQTTTPHSMLKAVESTTSRSFWQGSLRSLRTCLSPSTKEPGKLNIYSKLEIKDVKKYLPNEIDDAIAGYVCSTHLGQKRVIPLWNPSPIRGVHLKGRVRIDVGDVGTITGLGGFRVAYNILLDERTNRLCGYSVPVNFSQFIPPFVSEHCSIKDDANVIDLDNCGAFGTKKIWSQGNSRPLFKGFRNNYFKSSRNQGSLQLQISPTGDVKNRAYLHLPDGAKIYSFTNLCSDALVDYLERHLPYWLDHLEKLRQSQEAPPILLTSVWAARLFACATYSRRGKMHPSSTAELWKPDPKSDQMIWEPVGDGFTTMLAPMDDGFDQEGKIISKVEDQCFAIEGYVFLPLGNKAMKRIQKQTRTAL